MKTIIKAVDGIRVDRQFQIIEVYLREYGTEITKEGTGRKLSHKVWNRSYHVNFSKTKTGTFVFNIWWG